MIFNTEVNGESWYSAGLPFLSSHVCPLCFRLLSGTLNHHWTASSLQCGKYKDYKLPGNTELTTVWVGGMKRRGKTRKAEIKRPQYVDSICDGTCNAQDHFKPTALTQKNWIKCESRKMCPSECVGHFLISTHLLNTANTGILPFQRGKMDQVSSDPISLCDIS